MGKSILDGLTLQGPIEMVVIRGHVRTNRYDLYKALPPEKQAAWQRETTETKRIWENTFYKALTPTQRERVNKYFPRAIAAGYMQDNCPYTVTGYYWTGRESHLAWFIHKVLCPTKRYVITEEIKHGLTYFFDWLFLFTSMKFPPTRPIDWRVERQLMHKVFYD